MPKKKALWKSSTLSYKGTLQSSTPFHTTENFTEIQQIKIELVNTSDSGSVISRETELTVSLLKNTKD